MFQILHSLFSKTSQPSLAECLRKSMIVDVRTGSEFSNARLEGSVNHPLEKLRSGKSQLPKTQSIVVVCDDGERSACATGILKSKGFRNVTNGGSWRSVANILDRAGA